jgi:hypothetical protein
MTTGILDSGGRDEYATGAVRSAHAGKGRFDLLPYEALLEWALHMEEGCKHYGERNWERGLPTHRFADSLARHLAKYVAGHRDENHLGAIIWNAGALVTTVRRIEAGKLPKELETLGPNSVGPVCNNQ